MQRTKVRTWAMLALGSIALAGGAGAWTDAQAAVPVSAVGWWTRSPSPPTVPDGGIAVGVAPDGDLSVAAIKLDTAGGAAQAKLSLKESDAQGAEAASLQVCTTSDEWSAAKGDELDAAPRATCPAEPVLLTRASDGTWTADVASLIASQQGEVSIMVLPAPAPAPTPATVPGVDAAPPFQIAFDKPVVDGSVLPDTSSDASGSTTDSYASAPASSSFSTPAYSVASSPALSSVGNEASAVLPPTQAPASVTSPDAGGGQASFPVRSIGTETTGPSGLVVLGFVLLSLLVGGAAATLRWASEAGVFERLLPSGGGGMQPPPV